MEIVYYDRLTKKEQNEKVYGLGGIAFLYGGSVFARLLLPVIGKFPWFSQLFGWLQKRPASRKKIEPFIRKYQMDPSEFQDSIDSFGSFNDFFIRRLKAEARPIASGDDVVVLPADARYLVYPHIEEADGFVVKGKKFSLETLLQNSAQASKYAHGSLVIARLCPTDYHRFHFPCACLPGSVRLINGPLYSVNPIALKYNLSILAENKRVITELKTERFGTILFIEVGATNVGTVVQTYKPNQKVQKGEEKGYFAFGGSTILLLFEPGSVSFDQDLVDASSQHLEVRALMGQRLGISLERR